MRKNIILSLTVGALLSVSGALWTGCDDDGGSTTPPKGDMAMQQGGKDSGSPGDDMTMVKDCVETPASNVDFLNSCAPETVVAVELDPQFPAKAPDGVLPDLP
jgi:hypothetical protein